MPTDRHLQYAEIADFKPGLVTAGGTLLLPAQGFQTMTDCSPRPEGGVRAQTKPSAWTLTGITNLSTSKVKAAITFGGQGTGGADEHYVWMAETSGKTLDIWFDSGGWSWTKIKTHSYGAHIEPTVRLDTFTKSTAVNYIMYIIWENGSNPGVEGLWEVNRTAHTSASVDVTMTPTALCVLDDIVAVASGSVIYFSVSGSTALDHVNRFINVQASRWEPLITSMTYIAPSDILCSSGDVWSLVEGTLLTGPTIRSLSDAHRPTFLQTLHLTEVGIPFYEAAVGIVVTADGNNFSRLSEQIDPASFSSSGDVSGIGNLLLAPNGFGFDLRSKSWFRFSALAAGQEVQYGDHRDQVIVAALSGTNPTIYTVDPSNATRASTWTIKTAPFRGENGRRIRIRSVQVSYLSYHASDTIAVTVNGTTRTFTATGAGKDVANFLFDEEAEILDVQVVATADSGSHQAPDMEALRIGRQEGHRSL